MTDRESVEPITADNRQHDETRAANTADAGVPDPSVITQMLKGDRIELRQNGIPEKAKSAQHQGQRPKGLDMGKRNGDQGA